MRFPRNEIMGHTQGALEGLLLVGPNEVLRQRRVAEHLDLDAAIVRLSIDHQHRDEPRPAIGCRNYRRLDSVLTIDAFHEPHDDLRLQSQTMSRPRAHECKSAIACIRGGGTRSAGV